jgi:hypothetical protein
MSDDVFAEWKNNKFMIVEAALIDITDANLIILTDIEYWNDNYDALIEWSKEFNAEVRGMTVTCDDSTLTAFCLRW